MSGAVPGLAAEVDQLHQGLSEEVVRGLQWHPLLLQVCEMHYIISINQLRLVSQVVKHMTYVLAKLQDYKSRSNQRSDALYSSRMEGGRGGRSPNSCHTLP